MTKEQESEVHEYCLTRLALGRQPREEVPASLFSRARGANGRLSIALGIEEKFDMVLHNYVEYEKCLLDIAAHETVFRETSWSGLRTHIQLICRRFVNVLTSCRLYIDQVGHDLSALAGEGGDKHGSAHKHRLSEEYDRSFGYRAMEAARNYMQHRSLPIIGGSINSARGEGEPPHIAVSVHPHLDVEGMQGDPKTKAAIRKELGEVGQPVVVTPLLRQYVEGVCRVHEGLREDMAADVQGDDRFIGDILRRGRELFEVGDKNVVGLGIAAVNPNGTWSDKEHVGPFMTERRKELETKNRTLATLSRRFATGDCRRPRGD